MVTTAWVPVFGLLFLASFSSAAPHSCNDVSSDVEIDGKVAGEIISPNYPSNYPPNKDCTWKIKAPLGNVVRVTLTNLNLAKGDFLILSDGETAFPGNLIGKYSNCIDGKLSLFSTGSNMVVQFKSNAANDDKGFKLTFKVVKKSKIESGGKVSKTCSSDSRVPGSSGYIAHQEFPDSVSTTGSCTWGMQAGPSDKNLFLSYKMFGLAKKTNNFCEVNSIRHSLAGSRYLGDYFCTCKSPGNMRSVSNSGFLRFMSHEAKDAYPGFLVYFKALDSGACKEDSPCNQLIDDRDVGFDRNGNILFERKVVTTVPPPTTTPVPKKVEKKPFQVYCNRDEIEVILNISMYSELQYESATLVDSDCKAYHANATYVMIRTPLDGCGTTHNYSSDGRYINYHNEVLIQKKSKLKSTVITRDHQAAFAFECKYHRSAVLSVVHFTPDKAKVYTRTARFGNFTYQMKMYKSENYSEAYDKYPVLVLASQKIFFQTEVVAKDAELVLLVENCRVTPSKDRNDKEFYVIIEKGCERDETLKYDHKLSAIQRFNFRAFYFESDRDATIHIHCKVRVCRKADKNSRCVEGCPYTKRRRRSVELETDEISGTLTVGPITNGKHVKGSLYGRSSSRESRTMFVEIVIGVLGFVVVMLVVAVLVVLLKKRRDQKKSAIIVYVEDNE